MLVKVGSSLLVEQGGAVRRDWLATLVADITAQHASGRRKSSSVRWAQSGWVTGGRASLADAQASAVGDKFLLSGLWSELLGAQGLTAAQMLVTLDDLRIAVVI